jgi:TPP-dependent pyruvate/acetoin dehydrogenase alpha subunit
MSKRATAYAMPPIKVDGQDVERVYEAAHDALARVRSGAGPVFLDIETTRMHGHYIGDSQGYRSKEDRDEAASRDPIVLLRERLAVEQEEWDALEAEVAEIVAAAVEFARNGTDPQPEDALKNVYA